MYKIMNATKKLLAALFTLTLVAGQALSAQTIKTPAFAQPLVEQWVKVYNASHPDAPVSMAAKGAVADIQVVVSEQQEQQIHQSVSYFGRYAILPFAIEGSEAAKAFGEKKLSRSKLEHIYFEAGDDDEFDDYTNANKGMTIYSGSSQASVANSFAEYFGHTSSAFRGKRIQGDDRFVNLAVSRDQKGLSFNAVSNLFDLQSRSLKDGIQLLNLDVKKNVHIALVNEDLDALLETLETEDSDAIATANIGLSYQGDDTRILDFVSWVLNEGVQYNHQFGLLNTSTDLLLQASK